MKRRRRLNFMTRYVVVVGVLLLAANLALGVIGYQRSTDMIKALINKDMLDLANTAAALIDGDELGALTEEDVGSPVYGNILERLSAFQNHADIHYIYAIRQAGEEEFVFTVDADPDDPADFGEDVVVTPGMIRAGQGVAAVDDAPEADRWGNYYSAFSPVFDSEGKVAGVIGVDFDAVWFDQQVLKNTLYTSFTSVLSILGIAVVVVLLTHRVHKGLQVVNRGLSDLSSSVDKLTQEVGSMSGRATDAEGDKQEPEDELEELRGKIDDMQDNLRLYLDYLQTRAYKDALTKVSSSTAYHEMLQSLAGQIEKGQAQFCVGVFDINGLKEINDQNGHEYGDQIIVGAAKAISNVFGIGNTYRVGGDEFAVVMDHMEEKTMLEKMDAVEAEIAAYNAENTITLAISKGVSAFRPGQDASYKSVFARADEMMYKDKKAYYEKHPDRRKSRTAG